MQKNASVAFIQHNDKILSVSRKDDETKVGLPGGKVEPNETTEEAVVREVFEETGLTIVVKRKILSCIDECGYFTTCFQCDIIGDIPEEFIVEEHETGKVKWVTWDDLFTGPFGYYNKQVYNELYGKS